MIIIGHKAIKHPKFRYIKNINDIANSIASDILLFDINNDKNYIISQYCMNNELQYAILIYNITHALIYSNLSAKYLIFYSKNKALKAQKVANEYFFDSKIIYVINTEEEIESIAELGIDGVIFIDTLKSYLQNI